MSNGKYKTVLHRAIVYNKAARLSIPFSTGPSPDTVVVPAKRPVDGEHNQATYVSMNYKDYLEFKQSKVIDGKSYLNQKSNIFRLMPISARIALSRSRDDSEVFRPIRCLRWVVPIEYSGK
ncbi:hypothetical protein NL676_039181 [Syzygium grande]|nr:hypothetical protein NL676_039181 [Syzygium grande]